MRYVVHNIPWIYYNIDTVRSNAAMEYTAAVKNQKFQSFYRHSFLAATRRPINDFVQWYGDKTRGAFDRRNGHDPKDYLESTLFVYRSASGERRLLLKPFFFFSKKLKCRRKADGNAFNDPLIGYSVRFRKEICTIQTPHMDTKGRHNANK